MQNRTHLKHMLSCLPNQAMTVGVADERGCVVLRCDAYDRQLVARLVMCFMPEQHSVMAYRDESNPWPAWTPRAAPYVRVIELSGVIHRAQVVWLFDGDAVAVALEPVR